MTKEITTRNAGSVAPSQGGVGKTLAAAEAALCAPIDAAQWSSEEFQTALFAGGDGGPITAARWRACHEARASAPRLQEVEIRLRAAAEVIDAPPDRQRARALIGMLADAFPNARPPNAAAYFDTILHDVTDMGFSPAVLALACRNLRRTSKFLPAVAEIIAACETAREAANKRRAVAERLVECLRRIEEIAALPEPAPLRVVGGLDPA